ncbi:hypothetical protein AV530_002085 [Patagioenas fasciata monilis]|uniref:Uncharacterized protein n=1 Tax=Patagioenas fasciata monilis TaxID=372326 RepID=A0A1V4J6K3_PATFA|nr:hypothetical protein AV530_002085 [Patagioenas fasciata monilis]
MVLLNSSEEAKRPNVTPGRQKYNLCLSYFYIQEKKKNKQPLLIVLSLENHEGRSIIIFNGVAKKMHTEKETQLCLYHHPSMMLQPEVHLPGPKVLQPFWKSAPGFSSHTLAWGRSALHLFHLVQRL